MKYEISVIWHDEPMHVIKVNTERGGYFKDGVQGTYFEVCPEAGAPIFMIPLGRHVRFISIQPEKES